MRPRRHAWSGASLAIGATLIVLTGCSGSGSGGDDVDLAGRSFTSTEVRGHSLVPGSEIRLAFEEDSLSANGGCNTIFGGADWSDGTLTTPTQLAMTMMACEDDLAAQDDWLTALLSSSPAIRIDGDTLVLGDNTEGITMTEETP
jgi:heat shock protein HslJ